MGVTADTGKLWDIGVHTVLYTMSRERLVGLEGSGIRAVLAPMDTYDTPPPVALVMDWLNVGVPVIKSGKILAVVCKDGSHQSCTIAGLILSMAEKKPLRRVYETMHDLLLTQNGHAWWPNRKWEEMFYKNYSFLKGNW
ncbi:MAG: hypothetical protein UY48_C0003G0100 [Candidatus Gottesmanbacteria bacterium GW2011_GWB1_49_7]|uniref:Tyrosine specific protein phosphatases domain-containing protein n=1 Tax=Candidatus Gottesmanbacteria bacterium GW2011_GWB1_49_7 TaxID=1618448 RepID=A0A0G1W3K4_9BACT|nr:MAG: hypothetical protein UY48_C0003G0100 [Candidatus Gottesmanbacteria bacterium GW2011_GWB1_49_7]